MEESKLWEIRACIYHDFAETACPPNVDEVVLRFILWQV